MSGVTSGEAAYNAQTVVELKAELKKRGIPTTKLTRKQQIVDRLLQFDTESATEPAQESAPPATNDAPEITAKSAPLPQLDGSSDLPPQAAQAEGGVSGDAPGDVINFVAPTVEVATEPAPTIPTLASSPPEAEESRKRKRRSLTPAVKEQDVQKKLKDDDAIVTNPPESEASIIADAPIEIGKPDTTINLGAGITETEIMGEDGDTAAPVATTKVPETGRSAEEVAKEAPQPDNVDEQMQAADAPTKEETTQADVDVHHATTGQDDTQASHTLSKSQSTQEIDLPRSQPPEPDPAETSQRDEDERTVQPALHPATTALYIRGLQRPLHSDTFQEYLKSLAAKPSTTDDTDILAFHLDAIRTHAFASFTSLAAAARVRSALHDRVWPQERDRKPLWVDFVPEDQMHTWIEREKDDVQRNGARNGKRWEVIYEEKEEGNTIATFREVGATPSGPSHGHSHSHMNAPTAPRSMLPKPEVHREAPAHRNPESAQFLALDTLFRSTTAKPKVYYLPVERDIAERRLDELGAKTGGERGSGAAESANTADGRRYTWEEGVFVDAGPEFGLRQDRDVRGPPRGGGGGGYRGDRGYGGGGRGRGDAYRPGGGEYRPRDRRDAW